MTAPATVPATVTDAALGRLFNAANAAYEAWQRAKVWRKWEMWRAFVAAETAYWKAFSESNEGETNDQLGRTATESR